jgi:hypothetical protein
LHNRLVVQPSRVVHHALPFTRYPSLVAQRSLVCCHFRSFAPGSARRAALMPSR